MTGGFAGIGSTLSAANSAAATLEHPQWRCAADARVGQVAALRGWRTQQFERATCGTFTTSSFRFPAWRERVRGDAQRRAAPTRGRRGDAASEAAAQRDRGAGGAAAPVNPHRERSRRASISGRLAARLRFRRPAGDCWSQVYLTGFTAGPRSLTVQRVTYAAADETERSQARFIGNAIEAAYLAIEAVRGQQRLRPRRVRGGFRRDRPASWIGYFFIIFPAIVRSRCSTRSTGWAGK